jgi:uncharacterized membrane protein YphA (DoxX/SURF4 family)
LTPLGAAGASAVMLMAIFKSHWKNGLKKKTTGLRKGRLSRLFLAPAVLVERKNC